MNNLNIISHNNTTFHPPMESTRILSIQGTVSNNNRLGGIVAIIMTQMENGRDPQLGIDSTYSKLEVPVEASKAQVTHQEDSCKPMHQTLCQHKTLGQLEEVLWMFSNRMTYSNTLLYDSTWMISIPSLLKMEILVHMVI
jgi:hypothetical protein